VAGVLADRTRLLTGLATTLVMAVVLISFAQIKNLIPSLQPFVWDRFFVELDRTLHFGSLPHEYLLPLFDWHYVISFFTGIYNIWLFMMYFVLVIACFMRPESAARMQFLIAFVLTWAIGGNLMASVFSSAGPVYLERLGLGTDYAVLMQSLQAHAATGALTVIETQDLLWRWHTSEQPINAISAFPSMHVASSTLMALFAFRLSRWVGFLLTGFAIGIMVGSVLLAWHYAADGYVGALIAVTCWYLSGWLVRWSRDEPGLARVG
jgi:membrane-associated phospholipid phosphatase